MDQTMLANRAMTAGSGKKFAFSLSWVLVVFYALMFLRDIGGVDVPRIAVTVLCGLSFFFLPENEDFALIFAVIPFSSRLNFNEITLIFFVAFFLRRFNQKFGREILFVICVLFIELYNVFADSGDIMIFIRFAVLLLIGSLLMLVSMSREQVLRIVANYVFSTIAVCVDLFFITFTKISFDDFFSYGYRFGQLEHISDANYDALTSFNPNGFSFYIITAFSLLVMLWYVKRVPTLAFLGCGLFLLACYSFTQSRGGLLSLGAFLLIFWLGNLRSFKSFWKITFLLLLAVAVLFALFTGPLSVVYDRFVYRFSVDDVTGGRLDIWGAILEKQIENPLRFFFGFGTRGYNQITNGFSAHNTLLDIYASWGIVGSILMLFWHIFVVLNQCKVQKKGVAFIYFAPFLAALIRSLSIQFYLVTVFSLILSLTQLSIRLCEFDEDHFKSRRALKEELRTARAAERTEAAEEAVGSGV